MQFSVVKRPIVFADHKTSVSMENAFWDDLKEIARTQKLTLAELIAQIDVRRTGNRSSAIRLFVLEHFRARARMPLLPAVGREPAWTETKFPANE